MSDEAPSPTVVPGPAGGDARVERWDGDVVTADGRTVRLRAIRPDDVGRIEAFHSRQSPESIYFRYFSPRPRLSAAELRHFATVDFHDRVAFVALLDEVLVGIGRYDRYGDGPEAEVAFFIDDDHHGRGLATILLEYLAAAARTNGILTFLATVLPHNRKMLGVFKQAGFEVATRFSDGVIEVRFDIEPTPAALAAVEKRERSSEARSVARLLEPRSVAVIGAGRSRGTIGHEVFRQLIASDFAGPVYPVNREALHVASVRAYPSVFDVPDQVDLAVLAVPAVEVLDALEDCARARVGSLVVVSAGFAEASDEGAALEAELVTRARQHGVRLLGPASLGIVNTAPDVRLTASFAPLRPRAGRAALLLQSGTLGAAIVERAGEVGLGISQFVSVGNKADVSGNDLLAWWETDERTRVVLLSVESFGNPRRFRRIAPRVGRVKPVVAAVRGAIGGRSGGDDTELLLAQTGVVRVDGFGQLLDVARVLAWQPVPAGRRVAVVGNSDGVVALTAHAARAAGLEPAVLDDDALAALALVRRGRSGPGDPVDLGIEAGPEEYATALRAVLGSDAVDAVLVVYATTLAPRPAEVARVVVDAAALAPEVAVVASFPGHHLPGGLPDGDATHPVPNIDLPDGAALALGRAAGYGVWRRSPVGTVVAPEGLDVDRVRAVVRRSLEGCPVGDDTPVRLDPAAEGEVLAAVGATVAERRVVHGLEEAVAAAAEMAGPVSFKVWDRPQGSRNEAGGVALDLHGYDEVRRSFQRIAEAVGERVTPAIVQAMVEPGIDVRITVAPAPLVGSVLSVGPGGATGATLGPVARHVLPLTDVAADAVVAGAPFLASLPGAARTALCDLLLRVARLADEIAELHRLELDPVLASPSGASVTDARIDVAPWTPGDPRGIRRL